MNIVKRSKNFHLQQLVKKRFPSSAEKIQNLIFVSVLASWIGTYLDLYFVGKGLYYFPNRPMEEFFTINIAFTLIGIPLFIGVFLYICGFFNMLQRTGLTIVLAIFMAVMEKQAETFGFFIHHEDWRHVYSFLGYSLFLIILLAVHEWLGRK